MTFHATGRQGIRGRQRGWSHVGEVTEEMRSGQKKRRKRNWKGWDRTHPDIMRQKIHIEKEPANPVQCQSKSDENYSELIYLLHLFVSSAATEDLQSQASHSACPLPKFVYLSSPHLSLSYTSHSLPSLHAIPPHSAPHPFPPSHCSGVPKCVYDCIASRSYVLPQPAYQPILRHAR